jgi:hypothetical protein
MTDLPSRGRDAVGPVANVSGASDSHCGIEPRKSKSAGGSLPPREVVTGPASNQRPVYAPVDDRSMISQTAVLCERRFHHGTRQNRNARAVPRRGPKPGTPPTRTEAPLPDCETGRTNRARWHSAPDSTPALRLGRPNLLTELGASRGRFRAGFGLSDIGMPPNEWAMKSPKTAATNSCKGHASPPR